MSELTEALQLLSECFCDAWHVERQEAFDHERIAKDAIKEIERLETKVASLEKEKPRS